MRRFARIRSGPEHVEAAVVDRADRDDRCPDCDPLDLGLERRRIVDQVGLRKDDDRLGAALPGDREVALEAPQVEIEVEGDDDEDDIDIRADDLGLGPVAGRLADDRGAPGQDRVDRGVVGAAIDGDPVADRREDRRIAAGVVPEAAGDRRAPLAGGRPHDVRAAILGHDSGRLAPDRGVGSMVGSERRRPPQLIERRHGHRSANSLELAGPLGVSLGTAEGPQPERDEERAHHDKRPDVAQQLRDRRAVDEALADAVEDVGRRRQV